MRERSQQRGGLGVRHISVVILLLAALLVPLADRASAAESTNEESTNIVFLVDGSGSISSVDWQLQKDGLSAALQDAAAFPRDGSFAVGVIQWSFVSTGQTTRVEVPLTVVDSQATVQSLVSQVQAMSLMGSQTNPGDGIRAGTDHLLAAGQDPESTEWILCMSTDGTTNSGESLASATAYASASGVDRYSVVGIEDPPYENAASLHNHYNPHVFGGGSVTVARNSVEFANIVIGACVGDPVELRALEVNQAVQDWHNSVPLISEKATSVRAFVQVPDGEDSQRVAGRLHGRRNGVALPGSPLLAINPGSSILAEEDIEARRGQLDSSLNFQLPLSWRSGTVELEFDGAGTPVDCHEPAGPGSDPEEDCIVTVTFDDGGTPEIVFVGVRYANGGSTVEPTTAELFEQMFRFRSTLPIADIDYRMDRMGNYSSTPTLATVNRHLEFKRLLDVFSCIFSCADPTSFRSRYYGVLDGNGGGLANGIPGTVSSGFLSGTGARGDTGYARNRGPHELAHSLGRHHAVDPSLPRNARGQQVGHCGEVASGTAPGHTPFETVGGNTRPVLGPLSAGADSEIWGLDNRFVASNTNGLAVVDPNQTFDLMSYCGGGPQGRWASSFTYEGMIGSFPAPRVASSAADSGDDHVVVTGTIDFETGAVDFAPVQAMTGTPPAPLAGDYRVELRGSDGTVLVGADFEPIEMDADAPTPETPTGPAVGLMLVALPKPEAPIASIAVLQDGESVGTLNASANAPTLAITNPAGGENFTDPSVTFSWSGSDVDGDTLTYTVLYSADDGNMWDTLTIDTPATTLTLPRSDLLASSTARLQVVASDGVNTASVTSERFSVANNAPVPAIETPQDGAVFSGVQNIDLFGAGYDPEDGPLDGTALSWSSDIDGPLGSGEEVTVNASSLTEGTHVVTLTATDSNGLTAEDEVTIQVYRIFAPLDPEGAAAALRAAAEALDLDPSQLKLISFIDRIDREIAADNQDEACRAVDKYRDEIDRLANRRPALPPQDADLLTGLANDVSTALQC